jgi:two-component system response regulator AtoC
VLEHAMIFADHGWVTMKNLPQHFLESQHNLSGNIVPEGFSIKKGKMFLEKRLIEKALSRTDGNKTQAAELLEISYPALLLTQVNGN